MEDAAGGDAFPSGEDTSGGVPPPEAPADAGFPTEDATPAFDAPMEIPGGGPEIPEENKLTEWLASWKLELEAKNEEHNQATALVKETANAELATHKLEQEKKREAIQTKNRCKENIIG